MNRFFWAVLLLIQPAAGALAQGEGPLKRAERKAQEKVAEQREAQHKAYRDLERLRKDLRYISEELDREVVGPRRNLESYSREGLLRLGELKRRGNIHEALAPALKRLEDIYAGLPQKDYAKEYSRGLVKAINHELRWIAEEGVDEEEILKLLDENLSIPQDAPVDGKEIHPEALFPVDVPLKKFKKLGPIRIFLVKHRLKRPKSHVATDAAGIVAGKHNVQIGVELSGVVTAHDTHIDQDYSFDFGSLHIELTPEWRLLHPDIPKPKTGDKVKVRGWTYYDYFHTAEEEYDPDHPMIGLSRKTVWEVHPVQDIELLP